MTLDEIDKHIIKRLLGNARVKMIDISKECQVSITTIKNRINRLKKEGIIIDEALIIFPSFLGYNHPISIGINLEPEKEEDIYKVLEERVKIFGIDHFIGTYDIHILAYVKTLEDIQEIKKIIQKQKGVNEIEILLWNKAHFYFDNFQLKNLEL